MDCGHSYEERYDIALHDVRGLRRGLSRIDDVQVLGDACFSQCRYITHWAMGPCDELVEWLGVALARLEELAGGVELAWDGRGGRLAEGLATAEGAAATGTGGAGPRAARLPEAALGNGHVALGHGPSRRDARRRAGVTTLPAADERDGAAARLP